MAMASLGEVFAGFSLAEVGENPEKTYFLWGIGNQFVGRCYAFRMQMVWEGQL